MSKHKKTNQDPEFPELRKELQDQVIATGRPREMPSLELIRSETARLGLPDTDAEYIYNCWLANGYKNGNGRKVKDFKATIRVWHANQYFLSQKKKRVTRIEHVIQPPPEWTPPAPAWTPPTLEEVIEHAKTLQRDRRTSPEAATRRATRLANWCYAKWVGNKWIRYGVKIDSTEQWKALMVEMSEEFSRINK
jgi:hypothetical protein